MSWSIAEVARMSKVTSRTLRHYHDIGLLAPARTGANGYRYYEQPQLLRLQEILLLRELGLDLDSIGQIVAGEQDQLSALRRHYGWLQSERERLAEVARTVEDTIRKLEGGEEMTAEQLWNGFDPNSEKARALAAEAEERWGPQVATVNRKVAKWSKEKWAQIQQQYGDASQRIAELMDAGLPADDPQVIEAVDGHFQWLLNFWTPNRQSYAGLGDLYADDPRFAEQLNAVRPGFAEFMRHAMTAYALVRL
ncbi:TipAS antibiotic-recognition domain-containing protein [Fodinicola feengrottensis]|uniref:TipAS antibiotic-recognition domain-containing protein n=1 Tax=Fodinicola feengrottensis TaxID=435914 RepID=A0ABN2I3P9_9ACTN